VAGQGAGALYNALVSFALLAFLARCLGPRGFGEYVVLASAGVIALVVIEAGSPARLVRESTGIPARSREGAAWQVGRTSVMHVLTTSAVLSAIAGAMGLAGAAAAFACMGTTALANLVSARLRGAGRFLDDAFWQAAVRTTSALAIAGVAAWVSTEPAALFLAWLAASGTLLVVIGPRFIGKPSALGWLSGYRALGPFLVVEGGIALLMKGDVAIASVLGLSPEALAAYAACTRLTEAGLLFFAPIGNVLLPALRAQGGHAGAFGRLLGAALVVSLVLGLGLQLASQLAGPPIMAFLFGTQFASAGELLPWVALTLPLACANLATSAALIARDRERALALSLVLAVAVLPCGVWLGIAVGGARGAALGVATAQLVLLTCGLAVLLRRL
jgi:O-antigen/teichoic acid export membrane protein